MRGEIQDINNDYALVKFPDGRLINMRIENITNKIDSGRAIDIKTEIPPIDILE